MGTIRMNVSELTEIKNAILHMQNDVESYHEKLAKIASEIDMKVAARQDIDVTLTRIKNQLLKEKEYLNKLANMIDTCIDDFMAAEKIDHLPECNFSLGSVGGDLSEAVGDLKMQTNVHAVSDLNEIFTDKKSNAEVLCMSDYSGFAKYLKSEWK